MSDGDNEQLDSDRAMANLRAKWPIIFESAEVIGELKAKLASTTEELARVKRAYDNEAKMWEQTVQERDALTVAARQAEVALTLVRAKLARPDYAEVGGLFEADKKAESALAALRAVLQIKKVTTPTASVQPEPIMEELSRKSFDRAE